MQKARTVSLAVVLALLVSLLSACSSTQSDKEKTGTASPSPTPAAPAEKVKIVHWVFPLMSDAEKEKAFYKELTDQFTKENPNIEVDVQILPWAGRQQKMLTELASGAGPDVAYLNPDILATFASMNILVPLDDLIPADVKADYLPNALDGVRGTDGKIYAMPMLQSLVTYLYNKDLFKKAGLDPEKPPTTWEEFQKAIDALAKVDGIYPWSYEATNTLNMTFYPFLYQAGGEVITKDGKIAFNGPEGKRALEWIVKSYQAGQMPKESMTGITSSLFYEGKLAIAIGDAGAAVKKLRAENKFAFGVGPVLKDKRQVTYGTIGSYGIFKKTKDPKAAAKWVTFLTSTETMKRFNKETGFFPVKQSTMDLYKDDPVYNQMTQYLQYTRPDVFHPKARQIIEVLTPEIQAAMLGQKDPQKALDDAAKKADAALKQP